MIISHKHKFIFIKTRKTAGTSIEIYLSQFCGDEDIITPIMEDKSQIFNNRKVNNYKGWYNHSLPLAIKNKIGSDVFDNYFKFTIVRNPWDKIVSRYFWSLKRDFKNKNELPFEEWFDIYKNNLENKYIDENYKYAIINNEYVLDDYIKFECLHSDLERICKKIGIKYDITLLPHTKKNKKNKKHYLDYYNKNNFDYIEKKHQLDCKFFNYKEEYNEI